MLIEGLIHGGSCVGRMVKKILRMRYSGMHGRSENHAVIISGELCPALDLHLLIKKPKTEYGKFAAGQKETHRGN